ncbi:hypothetical protein GE061_012017 [Apolygus lucorum]|uniref:UBX domain-containing protein n=1 Tax=Apolygus lucorum TaxID=248454 RepID=A0A8S9XV83_APOLU|nr:hypothetical protein GE061_012017 [Apolygus lucorum]
MQNRSERMETLMQLRTKAMREKEEQRELKKYRYTLIRVRFPDGILLQGTFNVYEKARSVREFVLENLSCEGEFSLKNALGQEITSEDEDSTLLELKLVPAVLLTFAWRQPDAPASFLSPEALQLLQSA